MVALGGFTGPIAWPVLGSLLPVCCFEQELCLHWSKIRIRGNHAPLCSLFSSSIVLANWNCVLVHFGTSWIWPVEIYMHRGNARDRNRYAPCPTFQNAFSTQHSFYKRCKPAGFAHRLFDHRAP